MREVVPELTAWGTGARPYRRGDNAWPVAALQLNLNSFGNSLVMDGDYGPATERVARAFQGHRGLKVDGVIGPASQERICIDLASGAARDYELPVGLMRGLIENESGFMLAAYTDHPSDRGFDLGALQDAYSGPASQPEYRDSLNVRVQAHATATKLSGRFTTYRARGASYRAAWEAAALYHNWPVAADSRAKGDPPPHADEPAGWVEAASGGRLHTPREWADSYVERATRYVEW